MHVLSDSGKLSNMSNNDGERLEQSSGDSTGHSRRMWPFLELCSKLATVVKTSRTVPLGPLVGN